MKSHVPLKYFSSQGGRASTQGRKKGERKKINLMQEREMNGVRTTRDGGDVRKPAGLGEEEEGRGTGR